MLAFDPGGEFLHRPDVRPVGADSGNRFEPT